jgi:hypothetical protein
LLYARKNGHRYKGSTYRKTMKTREGFVREPTPVAMSVDEDEMINRTYGSLL